MQNINLQRVSSENVEKFNKGIAISISDLKSPFAEIIEHAS